MVADIDRRASNATSIVDGAVTHYETADGTVLLQLFGPDLGDSPEVFVPDVNHPDGGVMTPAKRVTGLMTPK